MKKQYFHSIHVQYSLHSISIQRQDKDKLWIESYNQKLFIHSGNILQITNNFKSKIKSYTTIQATFCSSSFLQEGFKKVLEAAKAGFCFPFPKTQLERRNKNHEGESEWMDQLG